MLAALLVPSVGLFVKDDHSIMEKAERIGFSVFVVSFVETVFDAVVEPGCA